MRLLETCSVFLLLMTIVLTPAALHAAWPPGGALVCDADRDQEKPKIISDGAGGAYIVWQDNRVSDQEIYVQRMDGSGNPYWMQDGIEITGPGDNDLLDIVPDGTGGVIIAWQHLSDSLFAQRIDACGTSLWTAGPAGGVHIDTGPEPEQVVVAADGAGGILIAWRDARDHDYNIFAQKLDSGGNEIWPQGGLHASSFTEDEEYPHIIADGMGGALVAFGSGSTGNWDIHVQRVYASGIVWSDDGVPLSDDSYYEMNAAICADGTGGAIVAWQSMPEFDYEILANRVDATGAVLWGSAGVIICHFTQDQEYPEILADGMGGAYIAWQDERAGWEIYAQRVDASGAALWTLNGSPVCEEDHDQLSPKLLTCAGGAIAVWHDTRGMGGLYGQRIGIGGGLQWLQDGVCIIEGECNFGDYDSDADGGGGLVATIMDDRMSSGNDIYAQAINFYGHVSSAEPDITAITDVPGDQGGYVRIAIARSDRDTLGLPLEPVSHYDVWQRVDDTAALRLIQEWVKCSQHTIAAVPSSQTVSSTASVGSGLVALIDYKGRRFIINSPAAVMPDGTWELIGSFDAAQSDEYLFRATTVADSSASGTPYSVYVVSAHTTNPAVWYISEPDSGYSVDNLPPGVPQGFAVAYNTGAGNQLTWDPSPEPDFQYYRIYRGDSEDFIPGPANLVHETATPDWIDPEYDGWNVHYKITALDYVGNESDAASPETTTGDDTPTVPAWFSLYQNTPNPFNPMTTIRFDLPHAVHVKLSVYNVKGELVATIVDQHMTEGRKEAIWTGVNDGGNAVVSGIYFCRLVAGEFVAIRKMALLR